MTSFLIFALLCVVVVLAWRMQGLARRVAELEGVVAKHERRLVLGLEP